MFANQFLGKFAAQLLVILAAISVTLAQATGRASADAYFPSGEAMDLVKLWTWFI